MCLARYERTMRSLAAFFLLLALAFPLALPAATAATAPVSLNELDFWIRAGRTDGEILTEVRQRGLLEPINSDAERRLRADGATPTLLSQLAAGKNGLVVSAEAAARARDEIALQAEKDKANRELALQRLRPAQPTPTQPAPSAGKQTPVLELDAIAEPPGSGADGWKVSFVNARKQALAEKKLVLVDFTGSDWCGWCKKLEKEVFDTRSSKIPPRRNSSSCARITPDAPRSHPR